VRIGGRRNPPPAETPQERVRRTTRSPVFGIAVITPLVFAGAVGGTPYIFPTNPSGPTAVRAAITPVAAVSPSGPDMSGPGVIVAQHPPTSFHIAAGAISAPPPPMIVKAPGALGIPTIALSAYRNAEMKMAAEAPGCGVSWNLLAGIGRIESGHANGGAVDAHGTAVYPIYGPALDGTLPGNEVILQSSAGNGVTYARAMGPMQFLPGTWARYAADGKGDGAPNPQNLFDSTLAAARYLCSGGLNLRDANGVMAAILRYNNSMPYAQNVLGWAAAYATGVVPVDLPPIVGPPPPLGSAHDEHPEGLGPSLPMNINGLPTYDMGPQEPLIDLSPPTLANSAPMFPWMTPPAPQGPAPVTRMPGCTLICIGGSSGAPGPLQAGQPVNVPPQAAPPLAPQAPQPPDPLAGTPFGPPPAAAPAAPLAPPDQPIPPAAPAPAASPAPAAPKASAAPKPGSQRSAPAAPAPAG
jgi:membrane-bound lytic murein transglycosylase B